MRKGKEKRQKYSACILLIFFSLMDAPLLNGFNQLVQGIFYR